MWDHTKLYDMMLEEQEDNKRKSDQISKMADYWRENGI